MKDEPEEGKCEDWTRGRGNNNKRTGQRKDNKD
jgi:hypothetical protein